MVYLILIFLGLAIGSFINALIWRIHEQESSKKKRKDAKLSITKGRSMCPACKHELAGKDLIPVLSWLSLGGKCRYCKKPISVQYPVVELSMAILFIVFVLDVNPGGIPPIDSVLGSYVFIFTLPLVAGLLALFVYDLKWMILPDRIVFPLIGFAILGRLYDAVGGGFDYMVLVHGAAGALLLGGLFYVLFVVSKGRWIGGGDVKLGILIGIELGPIGAYLCLLIASLLGSVVILTLMAAKIVKRNQQVPFGPFLIAAMWIVMLVGPEIIQWYSENFMAGLL